MKLSDMPIDKVNGAISVVKGLIELKSNIDHLELRKQLVEVQSNLVDAKSSIIDLQEQNREITEQLWVREQVVDEPNAVCVYVVKAGVKVPHCRFCYVDTGKLYQLPDDHERSVRCNKCKNYFAINPHIAEVSAVISRSDNRARPFTADLMNKRF